MIHFKEAKTILWLLYVKKCDFGGVSPPKSEENGSGPPKIESDPDLMDIYMWKKIRKKSLKIVVCSAFKLNICGRGGGGRGGETAMNP